jgi:hypothetical protein
VPKPRKDGACPIEAHALIAAIDEKLRANVEPKAVWRWVNEETPDDQVSLAHVETHARRHLSVKRVDSRPALRAAVAGIREPKGKPSDVLGRPVVQDDIDQRMMKRMYDAIDDIDPNKIADILLEREKAKNRAPVGKVARGGEEDISPDLAKLREAAQRTLGVRTSRTSARARAS